MDVTHDPIQDKGKGKLVQEEATDEEDDEDEEDDDEEEDEEGDEEMAEVRLTPSLTSHTSH